MINTIDLIVGTITNIKDMEQLEINIDKHLPTLKPGGHIAITTTPQLYDYVGMLLRLKNVEIRDMIMWLSHSGPTPTILGRKRFRGTVAANVIEFDTGGINIDACRVPTDESDKYDIRHYTNEDCFINNKPKVSEFQVKPKNDLGRFPANLLVEHTPYILSQFPDTKSGKMGPQHTRTTDGSPNGIYGKFDVNHPLSETYGDSGSASRFFNQINNRTELNQHLLKLLLPEQGTYIDITKEIK